MTANKNFKRRVRARAAKTGQSYTTALRHFRQAPAGDLMAEPKQLRLAVAQTILREDPRDSAGLRDSGRDIRRLMREAHEAGAALVHFPEGVTCSPHKRVMSVEGPDKVGPADWNRFEWNVLRQELAAIAEAARELRLWTVLGSVHRLTPPHRPHNSLYVISDRGEVVTRYDERMLSNTKVTHMYTPGSAPVTFGIDGLRFGLLLGMEVHFPELFIEYERLDVDCVLFSTAGPGRQTDDGSFATQAQAHAATNSYWVSYAGPAQDAVSGAPSGVISPAGRWVARCIEDGKPSMTIVDLDSGPRNFARLCRRTARSGVYDPHFVQDDHRSDDRRVF
ncbi:carbon-nitrogen hydrolase family protein [Amycolatopsis balhimycina DSM 5908]|uniref:Carbon-nitrogen hydrolase family protein n=2 Tax=Amycolatopsis balhimycina TaxID=208443 RepID=A0A428X6B4_AMYBA|nr:carbon-nitrogen hydrolase family protein [Amycolatopsis balhimycina DSM 5908]